MATNKVLAFDLGTSVVGILDVNGNTYIPYRYGTEMIEGAKRIISSMGAIVSFNGNGYDLMEMAKILGQSSVADLNISAEHNDMMKITSDIRWPPDSGTASILGPGLLETYRYYFGDEQAIPPAHLQDDYIIANWRDCYMTAELWKKWKRGELLP